MDSKSSTYLDELIEEGLVVRCDTGGSIGHPESNYFYMPTKGYNVWLDNPNGGRYSGEYLQYVRHYLGLVDSVYDIDEYQKWFDKNKTELEIMVNMDESYIEKEAVLNDDDINFIKSRDWFNDNLDIKNCLIDCEQGIKDDTEKISINKRILELCKKDIIHFKIKIDNANRDIEEINNNIPVRKKVIKWLNSIEDKTQKIQSCL